MPLAQCQWAQSAIKLIKINPLSSSETSRPPATSPSSAAVVMSIVSHGHGEQVALLLAQLGQLPAGSVQGVVLTLNAPSLDVSPALDAALGNAGLLERLNLQLLRNPEPLGFGANHNQAFKHARGPMGLPDTGGFCVVNPDIELAIQSPGALPGHALLPSLLAALAPPEVGMAYPAQLDAAAVALDFERVLPTPQAIFLRQLGRQPVRAPEVPDWVSGAFMAFKVDVFAGLGGFDERYFLYGEDVDICLRLQLAGYTLARASTSVIHHTHRQTLRNPRHLSWHVQSLLRLWRSTPYRQYREYLARRSQH